MEPTPYPEQPAKKTSGAAAKRAARGVRAVSYAKIDRAAAEKEKKSKIRKDLARKDRCPTLSFLGPSMMLVAATLFGLMAAMMYTNVHTHAWCGIPYTVVKWTFYTVMAEIVSMLICDSLFDRSPSSRYHTPLSLATQRGDTARVVEILREGADPNAGMAVGPYGLLGCGTPLSSVVGTDDTITAIALIDAGADTNAGELLGPGGMVSSLSLLFGLSTSGNATFAAALIKAGADPDKGMSVGPFGWLMTMSPLTFASLKQDVKMMKLLIKAGANPENGASLFSVFAFTVPASTPEIERLLDKAEKRYHSNVRLLGFNFQRVTHALRAPPTTWGWGSA